MPSPEAFLQVFTQRALKATSGPIVHLCKSDEPQTPWVSVTVVRNTSVGTWKPESGDPRTSEEITGFGRMFSRKREWPEGPVSTEG